MTSIPFMKMSGAGNDFIVIDNRGGIVSSDNLPHFVAQVCRRKLSVGADGLILIESSTSVDFQWQFFNSDGSVAEMCGNGARCAARFALLNGIASADMAFDTMAGCIRASVQGDLVKINMTDPESLVTEEHLHLSQGTLTYGRVNTGVPHVVLEVEDIENADVVPLGREIRLHERFAPAGTNVNFIAPLAGPLWAIRTYERGVEDETLACGTGVVAAALILAAQKGLPSPITLQSRSGSNLRVHFAQTEHHFREVYLEGDARVIYHGELHQGAWDY